MKILSITIEELATGQLSVRLLRDHGEFEPTAKECEAHDSFAHALVTLMAGAGATRVADEKARQ